LTGMKTKIFGTDSPEQRDAKIRQLEEQIAEAEQHVKDAAAEAQYVSDVGFSVLVSQRAGSSTRSPVMDESLFQKESGGG